MWIKKKIARKDAIVNSDMITPLLTEIICPVVRSNIKHAYQRKLGLWEDLYIDFVVRGHLFFIVRILRHFYCFIFYCTSLNEMFQQRSYEFFW